MILVGVVITQLTESGLFEKTKLAKEESENAQIEEQQTLADYKNKIEEYVNGTREELVIDKQTYEQLLSRIETLEELIDEEKYSQLLDKIKLLEEKSYCTTPSNTNSTASLNSPCVVIENYKNGSQWYRIWSDGWIEQGGYATGGANSTGAKISLLKSFTDTNYTLVTSDSITTHINAASCALVVTDKNTNNFYISSSWVSDSGWGYEQLPFNYYACGY